MREDHQAKFYEDYRKVAEEYDKEFLKKHEEDLDTTLIFVSPTSSLRPDTVLTRILGRFVLCGDLRLHHPGRLSTAARSK